MKNWLSEDIVIPLIIVVYFVWLVIAIAVIGIIGWAGFIRKRKIH